MKSTMRYWLAPIAHMALIFYLSSREQFPGPPSFIPYPDKIAHTFLYGLLGFLFLRALLKGEYARITWRAAGLAIALAALYGATDEFHQYFVPNRTTDVMDWLADLSGASLACAITALYVRTRTRNAQALENS
ncbi:MAG: VanZ family protein [bacterium]|nr:VanZ family protein [bacterium]